MIYKLLNECEHKASKRKPRVFISKEEVKQMIKNLEEDSRITGFFFWLEKIK